MAIKLNDSNYLILKCKNPTSVVFLFHGYGSDGYDLISIGKIWQQSHPNTIFIFPHGFYSCDDHIIGRQWFSLKDYSSRNQTFNSRQILNSIFCINDYIDDILNYYNIDSSKLVLTGFSQGSILALRAALGRKDLVGGVMSYSGSFVTERNFKPVSFPPIALFHGESDEIIPYKMLKNSEEYLKLINMDVEVYSYASLGHAISEEGVKDGSDFLQRVFSR